MIALSAQAPFWRRAFDWWRVQVKHVLPPTIFFFVGFNLVLWTKRLILEEQGIEFGGFFAATAAALLVGKAILVTDNLPFMRRFDGAPMIQPVLFKTAVYWMCVLIVRLPRGSSISSPPAARSPISRPTWSSTSPGHAFCRYRSG